MKKYYLIAGVNGAGKSTLYSALDYLKDIPRINTDEIVREFGSWDNPSDVYKAGRIAIKTIREYFSKGISFNQETTLCGKSIINNIKEAKQLGYEIEIHFVGVDSVDIAKDRIAHRVQNGGHGIPDEDVERRYNECFKQLNQIMDICDTVVFYDNTDVFNRFAIYKNGKVHFKSDQIPGWYKKYIK